MLAGTGGLDHLVARAVTFVEKAVAKADRGIIDDERFLVGEQT